MLFYSLLLWSFETQHVVAWPEEGTAWSLADPLCEPVWVETDAEKILLSRGSFIEAKRE